MLRSLSAKKSLNTKVYSTATKSQGKEALEFIAEVNAAHHMVWDNAKIEDRKAWREILR